MHASHGVRSFAFSVFGEALCSTGLPSTVARRARAGLSLAAKSSRSIRSASGYRPSPRRSSACRSLTTSPAVKPTAARPRSFHTPGGTPASSWASRSGISTVRRPSPTITSWNR
jgi:hypothetical protein